MKAAQYNQYGGPEVIEIKENAPEPKAGDGQVLIEIHAASLNPFDWKVRAGYMKDMMPMQFPVTIGGDFAGIVKEVGTGVTDFKVGDEIFGTAGIPNGGSGSIAEIAAAKASAIAKKPSDANFEEAASLPLTGASAVQGIEEHINLQNGQKIMINGGAGGIGTMAIQIAKSKGAYVAATAGTDDVEYVKGLGADEIIDYKSENFWEKLKDFDAVFDMVGGETADKLFDVVKNGGVIVSMVGQPNPDLATQKGVTAIGEGTKTTTEHLNRVRELIENGTIKPTIDKVYPLDQTRQAFEHLEKQSARGKIVVKIR
jgi:alcohol dehydrogenase